MVFVVLFLVIGVSSLSFVVRCVMCVLFVLDVLCGLWFGVCCVFWLV